MKSAQPPADPGYTFTREEVDSLNDGWTHYESDERRAAHRQAGDYNRHTHDYSIP